MKKIAIVLLALVAAFGLFACKSAAPTIEGEVTQEKVNDVLSQIYDAYRPMLDLSGAQTHTVVAGDTLSQITRKFYGDLVDVGDAGQHNGFYFPVIMAASDSHIVDPDLIEPGMALTIPDLKKNLAAPGSRKAIKDCLVAVSDVYNKKGSAVTEEGLTKLAASL